MDEAVYYESNRYDVSISIVRSPTRELIATLLNPPKIILTDNGLPRDWHGLAQLVGVGGEIIPNFKCGWCPTKKILEWWYKRNQKTATVKNLLLYLEQLDRFDIIDDVKELLEEDIKVYEQNATKIEPAIITDIDCDSNILTQDDIERIEDGLGPQKYDAFVLYADDDVNFATQLIDKLENQYKLKLCVKDDLVAGVLVNDSVIKLIAERCNRLVAVISNAFLKSSSNNFFLSFAQTIGIEQRQRKIIPCTYTECDIPPHLSCYFMLIREGLWLTSGRGYEMLYDQLTVVKSKTFIVSQKIAPMAQSKETKLSLQLEEENCLKLKTEKVKFNSMMDLNCQESNGITINENLGSMHSSTSLNCAAAQHKKKTRISWLKKILPHKNNKCAEKIIDNAPLRQKKGFWASHAKKKLAVAN